MPMIRIGCAGWAIPKQHADKFPALGSHLERYASRFPVVEINSSFYRAHRPSTYARWAQVVPANFRFTVKCPRSITHYKRLVNAIEVLSTFLHEAGHLEDKLGAILVQLPPSLVFSHEVATAFFSEFRLLFEGEVACEPRHPSWFAKAASAVLVEFHIQRVAAAPAMVPLAAEVSGDTNSAYVRLHGSPDMYYSNYEQPYLQELAKKLLRLRHCKTVWCIFDNTALGAAIENGLDLQRILAEATTNPPVTPVCRS